MKVRNIEETPGADGQPRWVVSFFKQDGSPAKPTMTEKEKPTEAVGDDIPVVMVKPDDGPWYYKRKQGAPTKQASKSAEKSYKADPEKRDDNLLQSALKAAVELYCHENPPSGKIDTAPVTAATAEIFASLIIMRPKHDK